MKFSIFRGTGKRISRFSLRGKALLITFSVLLSLLIVGGLGVDFLIRQSFARLESDWIKENAERIQQLIAVETENMTRLTYDYAVWSDTYNFISRPDQAYIKSNFSMDVFKNLQVYGAFIYLPDGKRRTGFTLNSREGDIEKAESGWDTILGALAKKVSAEKISAVSGLIKFNNRVYFISCHQVLRDGGLGQAQGYFMHLRMFNQVLLDRISNIAGLKISVKEIITETDSRESSLTGKDDYFFRENGADRIQLTVPFRDIFKKHVVAGVAFLDRKIYREGGRVRFLFYILLAFIVFIAGSLNHFLLKRLVIFRLEKMFTGVREIGETLDLSRRLDLHDGDEIDELADGINRMLDSLEDEKKRRDKLEKEKELMQEYMLQAKKMEAMGTMAGGIAHDFNNMLVIILGSAELLRADLPENHPVLDHVSDIEKAGNNASALVKRMMTINKGYSASKIYFSVNSTIRDMLSLVKANLPGYISINIFNRISDDLIYADIAQFQQVVINLVTNSAHAMAGRSKGNLDITVSDVTLPAADYRTETVSLAAGRYVKIEFSDTGSGISGDIQKRIFEPFFSTKPVGSGTGLGLAVVHGFILNNGGSIAVESEPGQGTRFVIHLPAVVEKRKTVIRANAENAHILVVDDDALVRKTIVSGIKRMGYIVHDAASGHSALKILEESSGIIKLVITDQMMPGMSGHELSGKIKSIMPWLPIVLISGYLSGLDDSGIELKNFVKVLMKPVSMADLDTLINEVLNEDSPVR